jgi:hypothetical protein
MALDLSLPSWVWLKAQVFEVSVIIIEIQYLEIWNSVSVEFNTKKLEACIFVIYKIIHSSL